VEAIGISGGLPSLVEEAKRLHTLKGETDQKLHDLRLEAATLQAGARRGEHIERDVLAYVARMRVLAQAVDAQTDPAARARMEADLYKVRSELARACPQLGDSQGA